MQKVKYIEIGDEVRYVKDNEGRRGYVTDYGQDWIKVRPITIDGQYAGGKLYSTEKWDQEFIGLSIFEKVELEVWSDHRGCDNSAIGIQGYFTPYTSVVGY